MKRILLAGIVMSGLAGVAFAQVDPAQLEAWKEEYRKSSPAVCLSAKSPEVQYVKKTVGGHESVLVQWKLPVFNSCSTPIEVSTRVNAKDKDGFMMNMGTSFVQLVRPGRDYLSGQMTVDGGSGFANVDVYRFELTGTDKLGNGKPFAVVEMAGLFARALKE